MGRKESKKKLKRIRRMKGRENKRERMREREFLSLFRMHIIKDGKPFYRLSKLLLLIFSLMNINGGHK